MQSIMVIGLMVYYINVHQTYIVKICVINEVEQNEGFIAKPYCMTWLKTQI